MQGNFQSVWCVLLLIAAAGIGEDARAESGTTEKSAWEWSIAPYIWVANTSYTLRANGRDIGAGNVDFGELADTLDGAFQVMAETGRSAGSWSGFVDFTYLSMSDDQLIDLAGLGSLSAATKSKQFFVDAAIAYWPWRDVSGFNVYAGIRYTDLDSQTRFDLVNPEIRLGVIDIERSFTDLLIGFRDRFRLAENWAVVIRGDYGFGDSDGVSLAQAALRWAVGPNRRQGLVLGYRYKDAKFKEGGQEERYKYKGPVLGFNFLF
jgi:hypothetical protein